MASFFKKMFVVLFLYVLEAQSISAFCLDNEKKMYEDFAESCRQAQIEYEGCDVDIYLESQVHRFDPSLITFSCLSHKPGRCGFAYSTYMSDYIPTNCFEPVTINSPTGIETKNQNPVSICGSVIEPTNQVLGEIINLDPMSFDLVYFTSRSSGKKSDYEIKFSIPNNSNTNEISLSFIKSGTPFYMNQFPGGTNFSYIWNGQNSDGIESWGGKKLFLNHKVLNNSQTVSENEFQVAVGNLKAKKLGIGGWLPSVWHFYDDNIKRIYFGNGSSRDINAISDGDYLRVASIDGSEVYYFDNLGRIVETRFGLTGTLKYKFLYDNTSGFLRKITDSHNKNTLFIYDTSNKLLKITTSNGIEIKTQLDSSGNLISLTRSSNEIFKMTYHQDSHLLKSFKKPNGLLSTFTYDSYGNLINDSNNSGFVSALTNSSTGMIVTSAMGRSRQFGYDNKTKTEMVISPTGFTTNYSNTESETSVSNPNYKIKKQLSDDSRFAGQVKYNSQITINNFGTRSITESRMFNLSDNSNPFSVQNFSKEITDGDSKVTHTYDGLTRSHRYESQEGRFSSVQTDALERPIFQQTGDLFPVKFSYDKDKLVTISQGERNTRFVYNSKDLIKTIINRAGHSQQYSYDQANRLSSIKLEDGRVVGLKYDSNNNLISITPPGRPSHLTSFGLNEEVASYTPPRIAGITNSSTTYSYNNDKDLIKISRPDGELINFNWNSMTGLLDSISGSFGNISRQYNNELPVLITDQHGQKTNLSYTGTIVTGMSVLNSNDSEIYYFNRSPSIKFPGLVGEESLRVGTDNKSILYEYDNDKLLTKIGDLNLEYNKPNGQLVNLKMDNIKEAYTYNNVGEVKSYSASVFKENKEIVIYSYLLSRDKLGRVIQKNEVFLNENDQQSNKVHGHHKKDDNKTETKYVYDKAGRLIHVHGERRNSNYIYDLNSNRIAGQTAQSPFIGIYDQQDRLIRFNTTTFNYNPNGEMISKTNLIKLDFKKRRPIYETTSMQYDVFGNLVKHGKVSYKIDPLNKRLARLVDGVTTNMYAYNPEGQMIAELDQNGRLSKYFVYGSKSHVPDYFIDSNNEKFKIITDHLGSVRYVVNSSTGEVKLKMNHDEFGKIIVDTNPNYLPFGFAGGIYDSATGLVRFGVRDYDAQIARWTSKDPIRFEGGDTNLYGYTENDPVNWIDDSGYVKKDPSADTGGAGVSGGGGVNFIVSPNGTAYPVPKGATGPTPTFNNSGANTGSAFTGGAGGANGQVSIMRIMNPTSPRGRNPGAPGGYIKYENSCGQGVDPYSGQTGTRGSTHFPID